MNLFFFLSNIIQYIVNFKCQVSVGRKIFLRKKNHDDDDGIYNDITKFFFFFFFLTLLFLNMCVRFYSIFSLLSFFFF